MADNPSLSPQLRLGANMTRVSWREPAEQVTL
jgi:hypothetical protein